MISSTFTSSTRALDLETPRTETHNLTQEITMENTASFNTRIFPYFQVIFALIAAGMLLPMGAISYVEGVGWQTYAFLGIFAVAIFPVLQAARHGRIASFNEMVVGMEGNIMVGVVAVLCLAALAVTCLLIF